MTAGEREYAFMFGLATIAIGSGLTWYARRLFTRPAETMRATIKKLGGERLPPGLRPGVFPRYLRAYAVFLGVFAAFLLVMGLGSLVSAVVW